MMELPYSTLAMALGIPQPPRPQGGHGGMGAQDPRRRAMDHGMARDSRDEMWVVLDEASTRPPHTFFMTPPLQSGNRSSPANGSCTPTPSSAMPGGGGLGPAPACEICNDRSTGKHYGVFSCEGCKGFFKRTIRQGLTYHCRDGGGCLIDKNLRNRCQACRFKKCINRGMKKEAVQEERRRPGHTSMQLDDYSVIQTYRTLIEKLISAEKELERDMTHEIATGSLAGSLGVPGGGGVCEMETSGGGGYGVKEERLGAWDPCSQASTPEERRQLDRRIHSHLRRTVEWAFKIPLFIDLQDVDKVALLASAFSQLFIITEVYQHKAATEQLSPGGMGSFPYFGVPGGSEEADNSKIRKLTDELVVQMSSLDIDKAEVGCLKSVILFNPESDRLRNDVKDTIETRRDMVFLALQEYIEAKYPNDVSRGNKILLRLPCLRTVGHRCVEELEVFKNYFSDPDTLSQLIWSYVKQSAQFYCHPSYHGSDSPKDPRETRERQPLAPWTRPPDSGSCDSDEDMEGSNDSIAGLTVV